MYVTLVGNHCINFFNGIRWGAVCKIQELLEILQPSCQMLICLAILRSCLPLYLYSESRTLTAYSWPIRLSNLWFIFENPSCLSITLAHNPRINKGLTVPPQVGLNATLPNDGETEGNFVLLVFSLVLPSLSLSWHISNRPFSSSKCEWNGWIPFRSLQTDTATNSPFFEVPSSFFSVCVSFTAS